MKFLDPASEPVRRWIYGTVLAVLGAAVVFGWVTGDQMVALAAVVGAALAIPAAEVARSKVSPTNGSTHDPSHDGLEE